MTAYDPSRLVAGTIGGGRDPSLVLALAGYLVAIAVSALTGGAAAAATGDTDGVATLPAGRAGRLLGGPGRDGPLRPTANGASPGPR